MNISCDDLDKMKKEFEKYNDRNEELDKINKNIDCANTDVKISGIFGKTYKYEDIYNLLSEKSHYDIDNNFVILKYPNIVKCLSENLTEDKKKILELYGIDVTPSDDEIIIESWKNFYRDNYKKQLEYIIKNLDFNNDYFYSNVKYIKNPTNKQIEKEKIKQAKRDRKEFLERYRLQHGPSYYGGGENDVCMDATDKVEQMLEMLLVNCNFIEENGYNGKEEFIKYFVNDNVKFWENFKKFLIILKKKPKYDNFYYDYYLKHFKNFKKMNEICNNGLYDFFFMEDVYEEYSKMIKENEFENIKKSLKNLKGRIERDRNLVFANDPWGQGQYYGLIKTHRELIQKAKEKYGLDLEYDPEYTIKEKPVITEPIVKKPVVKETGVVEDVESGVEDVESGVEDVEDVQKGLNEDVESIESSEQPQSYTAPLHEFTDEEKKRNERLGFNPDPFAHLRPEGGKRRSNKSRKNKRTRHLIKKKRNRKTTRKQVRRKHKTRRRQH